MKTRDLEGRYSRNRAGKSMKRAAKLLVFGLVVFASWFWVGPLLEVALHGNEVHAANAISPEALAKVIISKDIEGLKDGVIDELASKENGDGQALPAYADDNKAGTLARIDKVSYGCMAYKVSTVQAHYQTIYGQKLSNLDAVLLALDCTKAKALAKEAIFTIKGALWNWSAATPEMGTKVEIIRSLEK